MAAIRFPMSGGGGWRLISLYSDYAKRVRQNLNGEKPFEAIALSCLCLDVLLHHILDGLEKHHKPKLEPKQIECIRVLRQGQPTSGGIISGLARAEILDRRLLRALKRLNEVRNLLAHPFQAGELKDEAIIPIEHDTTEDMEYARGIYRLLCHVIDLAGGGSPLKGDRYRAGFARTLKRRRQQKGRVSNSR